VKVRLTEKGGGIKILMVPRSYAIDVKVSSRRASVHAQRKNISLSISCAGNGDILASFGEIR
jgi:hypothetical protein